MYYVQTSTDEGKTFDTVTRTPSRTRAFEDYVELADDTRALLFKDNSLILATHLADAEAYVQAYASKS
jgi:hypothetical protein